MRKGGGEGRGIEKDSRPLTLERAGNAKSRHLHSGPRYVLLCTFNYMKEADLVPT